MAVIDGEDDAQREQTLYESPAESFRGSGVAGF